MAAAAAVKALGDRITSLEEAAPAMATLSTRVATLEAAAAAEGDEASSISFKDELEALKQDLYGAHQAHKEELQAALAAAKSEMLSARQAALEASQGELLAKEALSSLKGELVGLIKEIREEHASSLAAAKAELLAKFAEDLQALEERSDSHTVASAAAPAVPIFTREAIQIKGETKSPLDTTSTAQATKLKLHVSAAEMLTSPDELFLANAKLAVKMLKKVADYVKSNGGKGPFGWQHDAMTTSAQHAVVAASAELREAGVPPQDAKEWYEALQAYTDIRGPTLDSQYKTVPVFSCHPPADVGMVTLSHLSAATDKLFRDFKEAFFASKKSDREAPEARGLVVDAWLAAIPEPVEAAVRISLGLGKVGAHVPRSLSMDAVKADTLEQMERLMERPDFDRNLLKQRGPGGARSAAAGHEPKSAAAPTPQALAAATMTLKQLLQLQESGNGAGGAGSQKGASTLKAAQAAPPCGNCKSKQHVTRSCPETKCNYEARGGEEGCFLANRCHFKAYHSEKQKVKDRALQAKANAAAAGGSAPAPPAGGAKK